MRTERLYLSDILQAANTLEGFLEGRNQRQFQEDTLVFSAVSYQLMIIGEAAAHITDALRQRYPEVPWRQITGFRNIIVHAYFATDMGIVWTTATEDIPAPVSYTHLDVYKRQAL